MSQLLELVIFLLRRSQLEMIILACHVYRFSPFGYHVRPQESLLGSKYAGTSICQQPLFNMMLTTDGMQPILC